MGSEPRVSTYARSGEPAYNLGGVAAQMGRPFSDCPYERELERRDWLAGWLWVTAQISNFKDLARFHVEKLRRDNADWTPLELTLLELARRRAPAIPYAVIGAITGRSAQSARVAFSRHIKIGRAA